jgi:hypothetical protein
MNTQQAYINGFFKRAAEYGFSEQEATELLKSAAPPAVTSVAAPAAKPRVPKKTVGTPEPVQGPRSASGARSYIDMNKAYGTPE